MRTNLQVPMDKKLRDVSAAVAREQGFSSLQDAVRMFLTQLSERRIKVSITQQVPDEILTRKQEAVVTKKYKDAVKDIKAGTGFVAEDAVDLINQLDTE